MTRFEVRRAHSNAPTAAEAVEELVRGLGPGSASAILIFCSPRYDLGALGPLLRARFDAPIAACSSAGQIGTSGFQVGGVTAVSFLGSKLKMVPHLIRPLSTCHAAAKEIAARVRPSGLVGPDAKMFALLLVDGLSMMEEPLAAALYQALGDVPMIGGSAGDDLEFKSTQVYFDGAFYSDAAVLAVFETTLPFQAFKTHHFAPTGRHLVITEAEPERRLVTEIDGLPAAEGYALGVGCSVDELSETVFSRNPLMLRIDDEYFIRSIQRVNSDLSLTFFCAIERGLVFNLGMPVDPVGILEDSLAAAQRGLGASVVIACDCILRRLQFEHDGIQSRIGQVMAEHGVVGFSTYGEQFNSLHMNQTFTGIAIGAGP